MMLWTAPPPARECARTVDILFSNAADLGDIWPLLGAADAEAAVQQDEVQR
jgi:hypothetical protein